VQRSRTAQEVRVSRPIIVFATRNPGKLREVAAGLGRVARVHGLGDFPPVAEPAESGASFAENARAKALAYAKLLAPHLEEGALVLAEDAGLEVYALDGYPGVRSSRIAADDEARRKLVLAKLRAGGYSDEDGRRARFVSAMALARGGEVLAQAEGEVAGVIAPQPRGSGGFGYDPIFFYPPYGKTFGECTPAEKRAVSHRTMALTAIMDFMRENLTEE
jgi:XTP/dITP diphosphohydrolase